ncbi:MAG TPA: CDP-diacylglycerol diphosphatase [Steroidobacteraceae bacterium]|nr:CDP-diacylglycerol diphosphatase [Steroidobacteraceae bacterium]
MNAQLRRILFTGIAATAVAAVPVAPASANDRQPPGAQYSGSSTDSPELGTGRDALRQVVQDRCVVNWSQRHDPAPCERVFLADAKTGNSGYAVLADRKGGAHYLLIPTQTMAGIESGELLDPDAPNYFAEAWHARDLITKFVGHVVPRTAIGLAVNTAHSRSQDQFHVHIECLRQDVFEALRTAAEHVTDIWSPVSVVGSTYDALRIMGEGLDGSNPFELLANLKPAVRHRMGDYTLVVAGMQFKSGPGFIALTGTGPTGELLLDSTCAVAGAGG